jgi:AcrR family transcriptional regulator
MVSKGEHTRLAILEAGLAMASQFGLENVTIGELAKVTGTSKSGLFAHFQSKENLQVEIVDFAARLFSEDVVVPALRQTAGIPRIKALVSNWVDWTEKLTGGCIFVSSSSEFSDRPGKVRDKLLRQQQEWLDCLEKIARSAIRAGDFGKDIDSEQFSFDLYSLLLGFHLYHKMLQKPDTKQRQQAALLRLIDAYR